MDSSINSVWQTIAYHIVHKVNIWLFVVIFATSFFAWQMGKKLAKSDATLRDARLAKKIAAGYTAIGIFLWLVKLVLS